MVWWTAPLQRYRNMPKRNYDSLLTGIILAIAEGPELAKSRRQRHPSITTVVTPTPDMPARHDRFRV